MGRCLEVVVVETESGAASDAIAALEAAGHHVHRCHEPGEPAFPCAGIDDRSRCPLEGRGIDVALTVRGRARTQPAALEDGLACAIRRHVPVVVAGNVTLHPYGDYATEVVDDGDVVAAVERAASAPLRRHEDAARLALATVLEIRGRAADAGAVTVRRSEGGLVASVALPAGLDRATSDMAAVRVVGALREVDPDAGGIDVEVTTGS